MASSPETSSPSPKRVKLTGAKRKTFLFLIARHSSWKATVSLPSMSAFSVGDVKNALKERSLPVPAFPKGKFEVIRADKAFQVAIFKYGRESVVGCRRTASKQHDALPCIIRWPSSSGNPTTSALGTTFCGVWNNHTRSMLVKLPWMLECRTGVLKRRQSYKGLMC